MPVFVVRGYLKQSKELMSITLAIGIFCHVACMIRTWRFLDTNSTKEIASLARGWREHGCLGIPPSITGRRGCRSIEICTGLDGKPTGRGYGLSKDESLLLGMTL